MNITKTACLLFAIFQSITINAQIILNIKDYGADSSGKNDNTVIFQKAIDDLAESGGGVLTIPKGTYGIKSVSFVGKKYSNITIKGQDATIKQLLPKDRKILKQSQFNTFATKLGADGCFLFDAGVSNQKKDSESIKNIHIYGLTFFSEVNKHGFDELLHQISAHGVSNFLVENCNFIGFLGDAIAINGGTDFSKNRNAYNKNIQIINCKFDGINKDNRQGISIYYADDFLIDKCVFENITREDMPGAIDIESDDPTNVSRNGMIKDCSFENIGGIGAIVFNIRASRKENNYSYKNFKVENCIFKNTNCVITVIGNEDFKNFSSKVNIIYLKNLKVTNSFMLFDFRKAYGISAENVTAQNIINTHHNLVTDGGASQINFLNCTFDGFANPNGLGFFGETKNINFIGNTFKNFNKNAITINSAKGLGEFSNNKFISTKTKGGLPLVTQYYKDKSDIENSKFSGNTSLQNFEKLNINFFYKP